MLQIVFKFSLDSIIFSAQSSHYPLLFWQKVLYFHTHKFFHQLFINFSSIHKNTRVKILKKSWLVRLYLESYIKPIQLN